MAGVYCLPNIALLSSRHNCCPAQGISWRDSSVVFCIKEHNFLIVVSCIFQMLRQLTLLIKAAMTIFHSLYLFYVVQFPFEDNIPAMYLFPPLSPTSCYFLFWLSASTFCLVCLTSLPPDKCFLPVHLILFTREADFSKPQASYMLSAR